MENAKESAFMPKLGETVAKEYFDNRRHGGIFSKREEIAEIERGYFPLGVFDVTRTDEIKEGILSTITKSIKKNNTFYVNLNNADLYYISGGIFKRKPRIKILDIIRKVADLPLESIAILSDIVKHGEISHEELNKRYFLFLNRGFDNILILQTRGLVEIKHGVLRMMPLDYVNNVDIPEFDDGVYNLKEFLCLGPVNKGYKIDTIVYSPISISEILRVFFNGNSELREIMYMPYDRCRYIDEKKRFRYETLISPKFL